MTDRIPNTHPGEMLSARYFGTSAKFWLGLQMAQREHPHHLGTEGQKR